MLPAHIPRDAVIVTRNLQRDYDIGGEVVHALGGVDVVIRKNEFVAIMGPSGSGKSTLMNLIGCLDSPTGGEYWLNGHRVSELDDDQLARIRNKEIGFVFQTFCHGPRRCTTWSCPWFTPAWGPRSAGRSRVMRSRGWG